MDSKIKCDHLFECGCDKKTCMEIHGEPCEDSLCDDEECKEYYDYRNDNCNCGGCGYCEFQALDFDRSNFPIFDKYEKLQEENEKLKKKNDELLFKETQTHNTNVSLMSKIEEADEKVKDIKIHFQASWDCVHQLGFILTDYKDRVAEVIEFNGLEDLFAEVNELPKKPEPRKYKMEELVKVKSTKPCSEKEKEFIKQFMKNREGKRILGKKKAENTTCDFCENERSVLTKRDAGYDEWTCEKCHKEQYEEEYEDADDDCPFV
tara:strand:- start:24 stop:812 length:789 start_codon:yes stop_codon:yes gene_type:complete